GAGAGLSAAHPRLGGDRHLAPAHPRGHGGDLRIARHPEPERRYRPRLLPHGRQRRRRSIRGVGRPVPAARPTARASGADRSRRRDPLRARPVHRARRSLLDGRPELRGNAMIAARLIAIMLALALAGSAAQAQSLIFGTSDPTISIHSNFSGETITLFG